MLLPSHHTHPLWSAHALHDAKLRHWVVALLVGVSDAGVSTWGEAGSVVLGASGASTLSTLLLV